MKHRFIPWCDLFPARAGMNRHENLIGDQYKSVPRTRGDEPGETPSAIKARNCSPHARG